MLQRSNLHKQYQIQPNIGPLKQISLTQMDHGKSKGDAKSYNSLFRRCYLCLDEKLQILDDQDKILSSKQWEIILHCHHQNKFKLLWQTMWIQMLLNKEQIHCIENVTSVVIRLKNVD